MRQHASHTAVCFDTERLDIAHVSECACTPRQAGPAQRRGRPHTPARRVRPGAAPDLPARLPLGGLQARALGVPRGALLRRALAPAARPRPALVGLPPRTAAAFRRLQT